MDKKMAFWILVILYFFFGRLVTRFLQFLDINWVYSYDLSSFLYVDFATIKLRDEMSVRGVAGQRERERGNRWKWKKNWRILSALFHRLEFLRCFFFFDLMNGQRCKFYVCFNRLCILIWQNFICLLAKLAMAAKPFEVVFITGFFFFFAWHFLRAAW